eukprot:maker-scaffold1174_size57200-snap-gene-0.0 protein:Tk10251 transcript:maker-scaffold1174_size57200-snap-gene-0.0-mRNA-1 annotation:"glycine cleavage system protein t"
MGEFLLTGPTAIDLIQKVSSNDATKLTIGKAQYSCLPNDQGGIVDDLIIYKIKEEQYLLVVNASNMEKDWDWISKHNTMGVDMKDLSMDYSLLAIQGPKAVEAMQSLTSVDLSKIPFYNFEVSDFAGIENGTLDLEVLKFIAKTVKQNKYGIKYLKLELILELNQ